MSNTLPENFQDKAYKDGYHDGSSGLEYPIIPDSSHYVIGFIDGRASIKPLIQGELFVLTDDAQ